MGRLIFVAAGPGIDFALLNSPCKIPLRYHFVGPVLFHLFAAGRPPVSGVLIRPHADKNKTPKRVFNFYGGW